MKKEIYSFQTQSNEFEIAYDNIKNLIGHISEFKGELDTIKKLIDKYTLNRFLSLKRFKNIDSGVVYEYETNKNRICVILNDFGNKIEDIIVHKETKDFGEFDCLVAELGFIKENNNECN